MSSTQGNIKRIDPPLIGIWLVQMLISEALVEEVLGDLEEVFQNRLKQKGVIRAKAHYFIDAVLSARNSNLRRKRKVTQNNSLPMFKNYVKTTFRTLAKNKIYSMLNILGLALGLAACLFILQYVDYEYSYDKFHAHHENTYRVQYKVYRSGELNIDCAAAVPRVGPFMKETMPEVVDFVRAFPMESVFETRENIQYREKRIHVVDPSFLNVFDYPFIHGDEQTALNEPNQIVITESIANKYFGRTDVVGETLEMHSWIGGMMEITGVTEDVPDNSHLKYNVLISYETLNNATRNDDGVASSETAWGWYDFNTYVFLTEGTDPLEFDKKFAEILYEERKEIFEKYDFLTDFPLQSITDIHLYSNLLQESEPQEQGDGDTVFFLSMIAVFILIIAWINYINLSTAKSLERAKEVGVRKSMGAHRKQLMYQFLTESFMLNLIALVLSIAIVVLFTPLFSRMVDSAISREFFLAPRFWVAALGVLITGTLVSGLYPAFILSSFQPMEVLKGKLTTNHKGIFLRKGLVIFQFAASVTLITGTLIVYQQLSHIKEADLGFEMSNTLVLRGPNSSDSTFASTLTAFQDDLKTRASIMAVTGSSNVPGDEIFWTRGMRKASDTEDKNFISYLVGVDHSYFSTLGIEFLAGRNYDENMSTDTVNVLINRTAMESLKIASPEDAIGVKIIAGGDTRTIIGVVDNYQQLSLKNDINPLVFPLVESASDFLTVKLATENYAEAFEEIKASYQSFFPGSPFDTFFLDEFYNRQYVNEKTFSQTFTLFAVFAILVACLGLFGLTSFTALQRTKEIGVRKVLGADVSQLVMILSKEFLVLIGIANVLSWPIVYLLMDGWLNNFSSRISIGIPVFFIALVLVLLIALIAVGYKTVTTARTNPVSALRYE